jgi:hypothetical protein
MVRKIGTGTVERLMMNEVAGIRVERHPSFRATHPEVFVYPDPGGWGWRGA